MHARNDINDPCEVRKDVAARAAIELVAGRSLTDMEWAAARDRLLEFMSILRGWDRKSTARQLGNVEVLCQREL
jgi:hypothetical protein